MKKIAAHETEIDLFVDRRIFAEHDPRIEKIARRFVELIRGRRDARPKYGGIHTFV